MNTKYWPKHPDGRNKKVGEMTSLEKRVVTRNAVRVVAKQLAREGVRVTSAEDLT